MNTKQIQEKIQPFHQRAEAFAREIQSDPLIAHLLLHRGIDTIDGARNFLAPDYERHLHDPFLFPDMEKIVDRIRQAISLRETVGVFGDYDADGVTGSALFREALSGLGLQTVGYIPHKHHEGYGLSVKGLEAFREAGVSLFFTVDCGITNVAEFESANKMGLEGIVIDHHHVPETMPSALAVVNPKIPNCGYPFSDLSGAGAAFKVAQGLYRAIVPDREKDLKWLLDLAAIGTVADCMPLVGENRVIARFGSVVLAKTRRPGLRALYERARIVADDSKHPDAETIAFRIAPRINAAGRMAHAWTAHRLLLETNTDQARLLADELERYNDDRRKVSAEVTDHARKRVIAECAHKKAIVVADESFAPGVIGLAAGKLAEEFGKPTAIFSKGESESVGSLRSAGTVHLAEILAKCDDLLQKYGGHREAAGLTVANDQFEAFCNRFESLVDDALSREEILNEPNIDAELVATHFDEAILSQLKRFAPFGIGNAEPVFFVRDATVANIRFLGNDRQHLKLTLRIDGNSGESVVVDAIGFSMGKAHMHLSIGSRVSVSGRLRENVWNGSRSWQLELQSVSEKSKTDDGVNLKQKEVL
jgi:single-stranded-DNA-specific exonuclease